MADDRCVFGLNQAEAVVKVDLKIVRKNIEINKNRLWV